MTEEERIAVQTPSRLRTDRQREIIFGDCTPDRDKTAWDARQTELVRRLEASLPLSRADRREALRIRKERTR